MAFSTAFIWLNNNCSAVSMLVFWESISRWLVNMRGIFFHEHTTFTRNLLLQRYYCKEIITLISWAPLVPNLFSTLQSRWKMRSLASSDIFGSSGNFKQVFQFNIWLNDREQHIKCHKLAIADKWSNNNKELHPACLATGCPRIIGTKRRITHKHLIQDRPKRPPITFHSIPSF